MPISPNSPPTYPVGTLETSKDEVLERAKVKFPPTPEELAAERAMNEARAAYNDFLARASKSMVDMGLGEGQTYGFGYPDPKYDAEREEVHDLVTRATVKYNRLVAIRQARIRAQWEAENAKLAIEAQRGWQKGRR